MAAAISYEEFLERVLRYQRTSLTIACTKVGWTSWQNDQTNTLSLQDAHVCRAHIGTVAAISAAIGSELGPRIATEQDAIRLCHEFLGIEERLLAADRASSQELVDLLRASKVFGSYPASVEAVGHAVLNLALAPLLLSQWSGRIAAYQGVHRAWELLRRLYRRHDGLLERHTAALRIEPRAYVMGGFALFALLQAQKSPGFHDVASTTFEGGIERAIDADVNSLMLVASRLSRTRDELRTWHDDVMRLDPLDRKYATSPLVANPLIKIDDSFVGANKTGWQVICPSPDHFVWALQTSAVTALLDAERPGENLKSELGDALAEYVGDVLRHTCGADAVTSVDDLPVVGKKADYIVTDGSRALVIEVKRSVWGAQQRSVGRPADVVNMWERLYEPCEQIASTIDALRTMERFRTITNYVPVTCVDDALLFHGRAFISICRNLGVFDRLRLPGLEILSVLELEKGLVSIGPSKLIDLVLEKQGSPSRDGMLGPYAAEHSPPVMKEHSNWAFLDGAERELTPQDPGSLQG